MAISVGQSAEATRVSGEQGAGQDWPSSDWGTPAPQAFDASTHEKEPAIGSAAAGITIPEPSNLMMLGLGLAGLIAGRLVARRRKGN